MNASPAKGLTFVLFVSMLASCGGGGGGGGGDTGGGGGGGGGGGAGTGITWTTRRAGITRPVNAVARSTTKFIAVIDNGTASTSPDGYSWTTPVQTGFFTFQDVVWGNNEFMATGSFGYIAASSDGVTWTKRSECPGICTDKLLSIAWSGSRYVAAVILLALASITVVLYAIAQII